MEKLYDIYLEGFQSLQKLRTNKGVFVLRYSFKNDTCKLDLKYAKYNDETAVVCGVVWCVMWCAWRCAARQSLRFSVTRGTN